MSLNDYRKLVKIYLIVFMKCIQKKIQLPENNNFYILKTIVCSHIISKYLAK